ncbi:MAG: sugar phosphate isomerase/epimerase [Candidatus Gracilibacteria bacterium]|nr:sugar phosphate isomerase/epimerase [Candidatus Gracilibacteria bacterium]
MVLLSTDSLKGYGLSRIFRFAKEVGFDGIEVALDLHLFDTQNAEYLNELQKEHGLKIRVVRTFRNSTVKQSSLALEIAQDVGAKMVILDPPKIFDFTYKSWLKKEVPKLRKKYQLDIALKNGGSEYTLGFIPGRSMTSVADLQNFEQVCLDISNLYGKNQDLMRVYDVLKPHLKHVHLSNVDKGKEGSMLDKGIMPLESFLTKLKGDQYKGDVSLVVRPRALGVGDDRIMMRSLEKSLGFVKKYMSGRL